MALNFSQYVNTMLQSDQEGVLATYSPMATKLTVVRDYINRLKNVNQAYSTLINALASDPDMLSDDLLNEGPYISIADLGLGKFSGITRDTFNLVNQAFSDAFFILNGISDVREIQNGEGFTIIDSEGLTFVIIKTDSGWSVQHQIDSEGTVQTILTPLLQSYTDAHNRILYRFNNVMMSVEGNIGKTFSGFLNSISISATLNVITERISSLIMAGRANAASVASTLREFLSSEVSAVREWASTLESAWNYNGVFGVIEYIIHSLSATQHVAVDDDGVMSFTDNYALIPKEFIGTMIADLATTAGAAMVMFGGVFLKILGAAVSLGSQAFKWFKSSVWDIYKNDTVAGVIDTDAELTTTVLPEFPQAMCQIETVNVDHSFIDIITSNGGFLNWQIPGGLVHIGLGSIAGSVRMEIHPHAFWTCDLSGGSFTKWYIPAGNTVNGITYGSDTFFSSSSYGINVNQIISKWRNGYQVEYTYDESAPNSSRLVMDASSDILCRRVLCHNLAIMLVYLSSIMKQESGTNYYLYLDKTEQADRLILTGYDAPFGGSGLLSNRAASIFSWFQCNPTVINVTYRNLLNPNMEADYQINTPTWSQISTYCANFANISYISSLHSGVGNVYKATCQFDNNVHALIPIVDSNFSPVYDTSSPSIALKDALVFAADNAKAYMIGKCDICQTIMSSAIYTPEYNRDTFWLWVGIVGVSAAVIATATVVVPMKLRSYINRRRISYSGRIASAYDNLKSDPTNPAYITEYSRTMKRANLFQKITKGTPFAMTGFAGSTNGSTPESAVNKLANFFSPEEISDDNTDRLNSIHQTVSEDASKMNDIQDVVVDNAETLKVVLYAITGHND